MTKIVFEFKDRKIRIEVDGLGRYENDWDTIREATDRLESQGIQVGSFHGKVTITSELS